MKVQQFTKNPIGRDFVVGDLHGCHSGFMKALEAIEFDSYCDRILCVGDLVDRGPDSPGTLELMKEDWFWSIKGNHEEMIENGYTSGYNGATWAKKLMTDDPGRYSELLGIISTMPYAFDIHYGDKRYVVTHAELPQICYRPEGQIDQIYTHEITHRLSSEDPVTWGRYMKHFNNVIPGVEWVIHGHTVFSSPQIAGNRIHLDTGFYYGTESDKPSTLTLFQLGKDELIQVLINHHNNDKPIITRSTPTRPSDLEHQAESNEWPI
jgi:serine/threonine protein phosphatase 1